MISLYISIKVSWAPDYRVPDYMSGPFYKTLFLRRFEKIMSLFFRIDVQVSTHPLSHTNRFCPTGEMWKYCPMEWIITRFSWKQKYMLCVCIAYIQRSIPQHSKTQHTNDDDDDDVQKSELQYKPPQMLPHTICKLTWKLICFCRQLRRQGYLQRAITSLLKLKKETVHHIGEACATHHVDSKPTKHHRPSKAEGTV